MSDRSMLIRPALTIAFAMLAASAVPALAEEKAVNGNDAAQADSQPARKYCLSTTMTGDPITGSLIPRRQCLTQDQWVAKGVTFKAR